MSVVVLGLAVLAGLTAACSEEDAAVSDDAGRAAVSGALDGVEVEVHQEPG
jgi:hypothetical protein